MKKAIIAIMLLGVFFVSGCATTGTLDDTRAKAPHRLKEEVLNYPFNEVYDAAKRSILNLGLALDSEDKQGKTAILYGKSPANMAKIFGFGTGYGEMVGIYLTPVSDGQTKVEVALQKSYRLDWGYKDYRGLVINQIKTILELKNR